MAVCEIWDVRGRLDHPIDYAENPEKTANPKYSEADLQAMVDVMEYATNKNKTEQRFFVTGVNCDPTTARDEMMIAKAQWNDMSEIVCYHGFQSFKHGEVTPEQAHEVGVKLAERMWGDRFQVIVATHLNTDCLHNHFVVNSVSFADGMHYHDNKANLRLLRQRSDELCREYALSVRAGKLHLDKNNRWLYHIMDAKKKIELLDDRMNKLRKIMLGEKLPGTYGRSEMDVR